VPINKTLEPAGAEYEAPKELKTWYTKAIKLLMYAMLRTRLDIAFAVSSCSRHLGNPIEAHKTAVKGVMRYLKGTISL
jgi:hypothetical protein